MILLILLSVLGIQAQGVQAQNDSLDAPYKRFPTIPPFDLMATDSVSHITKENIEKKHNTLIMYFSPECSHCQHQTEEMLAGMDSLKSIQIVMATYFSYEEMMGFYQKYKLAQYPNIKLGRDTKFFLPPYYRMKNLPYLALYDKKGNLITTFEGNQTLATLVGAFDGKTEKRPENR